MKTKNRGGLISGRLWDHPGGPGQPRQEVERGGGFGHLSWLESSAHRKWGVAARACWPLPGILNEVWAVCYGGGSLDVEGTHVRHPPFLAASHLPEPPNWPPQWGGRWLGVHASILTGQSETIRRDWKRAANKCPLGAAASARRHQYTWL